MSEPGIGKPKSSLGLPSGILGIQPLPKKEEAKIVEAPKPAPEDLQELKEELKKDPITNEAQVKII
jgi:hypothetical protein